MAESDRLGLLEMSISRHDRLFIFFSSFEESPDERLEEEISFFCPASEIESQILGNLVIAASRRMEFLSCLPKPLCKLFLDEHVDIFTFGVYKKLPALKFRKDFL